MILRSLLFYMLLYGLFGILLDCYQAVTLSASNNIQAHDSVGFFVSTAGATIKSTINYQLGWQVTAVSSAPTFCILRNRLSARIRQLLQAGKLHFEPLHHTCQRRIDEIVVLGV